MIDLHCHILPGVDDGSRDLEESSQMLDLARRSGTRAIVATPHADLQYRFNVQRCLELLARLQEANPFGPRLYIGCEVHLTAENLATMEVSPRVFTLNGGDCVLLELPNRIVPDLVDSAVERLMDSGLRVVIAHPERNPFLQDHLSYADRLVDAGCYLQLTARSLSGGFGSAAMSAASYLLNRRLTHFIASDAHGVVTRRPDLSSTWQRIVKGYGEPTARLLLKDNPQASLNGSPFRTMPPAIGWLASIFSRPVNDYPKPIFPEMR
jgi:protein-tyrosine phosphatase